MTKDTHSTGALEAIVFKNRAFSIDDLKLIQEIVATYNQLGRQEIAQTIAELLEWERPNGSPKWRECRDLLDKLDEEGVVELPELQRTKPRGSTTRVPVTERGEPGEEVVGSLRDVAPVQLELVEEEDDRLLWRELIGRYHYLGHKVPFGAHLRYLIRASRPAEAVVGCIQVSSPAWKVAARDEWIGWDGESRQQRLQRVVNNSRFLLLPWIRVKYLASHVLSKLAKRIGADWQQAYGVTPVLMETFVDSSRFEGTCYRAAGWTWLGTTSGRGRMDSHHERTGAAPKEIFVRCLRRHAPRLLREGS